MIKRLALIALVGASVFTVGAPASASCHYTNPLCMISTTPVCIPFGTYEICVV